MQLQNFRLAMKISSFILGQALKEVQSHPELWNQNELRTKHQGTMHSDVDDIWLRFNKINGNLPNILNDVEAIWYPPADVLRCIVGMIHTVFQMERGVRLGRCFLSRLRPGGRIRRHEDQGAYPAYYERYHVVLQGGPGNFFFCGNENIEMQSGEVWWFQNLVEHEVVNHMQQDRIHLIMDLKQ